jgi:hypothetical protein
LVAALVPPKVVTVTATSPVPGGATTVSELTWGSVGISFTVTLVALVAPKWTAMLPP